MEFGKVGNVTFPITKLMVLRGPNPRFSGKSIMCYGLKHKWKCFGGKSCKSWNRVFKSLKYHWVYKWILQLFKTAKSRKHWFLLSRFHEISWDFHEKAPRIDTCPNFIDTFPMMFSGFRGKAWKTLHKHWRFLVLLESKFLSSPRSKYQLNHKEYWWVWEAIFHEKHLNRQPGVRTGFKVLEPGADFWPKNRKVGQKV